MHSTLSRLNAVSALATTIILVLVALIDLTHLPFLTSSRTFSSSSAAVVINQLEVVRGKAVWHMDRNVQDFVEVDFNIDADFSTLFDWNTKQVFVSLAATYDNAQHVKNEVVIWDRILRTKQDAHVALNNSKNKYGFREVGRSFKNVKNATFTLKYNVMPKVGFLHYANHMTTKVIPINNQKQIQSSHENHHPKVQRLYY
ncbi:related to SPC3 - signal peptidase subunit [Melanopsichium pennsylvanicum]|uniref:Signal peptidase subunit 3 n=1 Tax=Melanopsichium pennsylvanicum TaxID=63383 RepID=A0AAJ4XLM3_9BASI|nr:related to SPC3 - signal peptidase subunit [Melanopsichium pennsylvanicum]